jgi:hypothetical protein
MRSRLQLPRTVIEKNMTAVVKDEAENDHLADHTALEADTGILETEIEIAVTVTAAVIAIRDVNVVVIGVKYDMGH